MHTRDAQIQHSDCYHVCDMLRIMIIKHVIIFNAQTYTIVDLKGIQSIRNYNYYFVVVVEVAVFEQR